MDHTDKAGNSKLLKKCTLPLTGMACVQRIITNLGVFDVVAGGLKLVEIAPGVTADEIKAKTEATLVIRNRAVDAELGEEARAHQRALRLAPEAAAEMKESPTGRVSA